MNPINAIKVFSTIALIQIIQVSLCTGVTGMDFFTKSDTLYILFEETVHNSIDKSSRTHPSENDYPKDWGRRYNVIIKNHIHIWFSYHNNLPEWSDMVFEYNEINQHFIENHDFKDQEWFRKTPKEEIIELFFGKEPVVYLVEKDRIKDSKAIMIRVYPDKQTVE